MKRNLNQVTIVLTEIGLKRFQQVPTFKNLLFPNQIAALRVGENSLTVNQTVYGSLSRVAGYDRENITIK